MAPSANFPRSGEGTLRPDDGCPLSIIDLTDVDRDLAQLEATVANALTGEANSRGLG
jgi:hypothetical protein